MYIRVNTNLSVEDVEAIHKDMQAHDVDPLSWAYTGEDGSIIFDVEEENVRFAEHYVRVHETVREANMRLKKIAEADIDFFDDDSESNVVTIEAFGMNYQPCSVSMWTSTPNSSADVQMEVIQIPSAEMMKFDTTLDFLEEYIKVLRVVCNNYDLDQS